VLPFSDASGDPNAVYISDGITEGIIDRLSGLPNLKVISRTSAFRYKRREIEPQKVGKGTQTPTSPPETSQSRIREVAMKDHTHDAPISSGNTSPAFPKWHSVNADAFAGSSGPT
jgi:hypothetical protein